MFSRTLVYECSQAKGQAAGKQQGIQAAATGLMMQSFSESSQRQIEKMDMIVGALYNVLITLTFLCTSAVLGAATALFSLAVLPSVLSLINSRLPDYSTISRSAWRYLDLAAELSWSFIRFAWHVLCIFLVLVVSIGLAVAIDLISTKIQTDVVRIASVDRLLDRTDPRHVPIASDMIIYTSVLHPQLRRHLLQQQDCRRSVAHHVNSILDNHMLPLVLKEHKWHHNWILYTIPTSWFPSLLRPDLYFPIHVASHLSTELVDLKRVHGHCLNVSEDAAVALHNTLRYLDTALDLGLPPPSRPHPVILPPSYSPEPRSLEEWHGEASFLRSLCNPSKADDTGDARECLSDLLAHISRLVIRFTALVEPTAGPDVCFTIMTERTLALPGYLAEAGVGTGPEYRRRTRLMEWWSGYQRFTWMDSKEEEGDASPPHGLDHEGYQRLTWVDAEEQKDDASPSRGSEQRGDQVVDRGTGYTVSNL
ncbi:hypothetical protein KVT40_009233 [Elsinoe batatas]|uniref:Uncharacterized protein n=1 Tax=Elsinoe batatas TaxID=2601811 RepID=A0A8K0KS79_9PEZI|nr:hypothetical protein KVT40_009233 [Elsinoe batatas]